MYGAFLFCTCARHVRKLNSRRNATISKLFAPTSLSLFSDRIWELRVRVWSALGFLQKKVISLWSPWRTRQAHHGGLTAKSAATGVDAKDRSGITQGRCLFFELWFPGDLLDVQLIHKGMKAPRVTLRYRTHKPKTEHFPDWAKGWKKKGKTRNAISSVWARNAKDPLSHDPQISAYFFG